MRYRALLRTALVALAMLGGAVSSATASPSAPQQAQPAPRPPSRPTVEGKVINAQASGNQTEVTVAVAAGHPVQPGWRGQLVDAGGKPVAGGAFTVHSVRKRQVVGTVTGLSPQAVTGATVVLGPP